LGRRNGRSKQYGIVYPENSVVWTKPGTIGIFVFNDPIEVYYRIGGDPRSMAVEVFPLGWQVKPKKVLFADQLSYYYFLANRCGITNIWEILNEFQNPRLQSPFQDLWLGTVCCEGVLVGKEVSKEYIYNLCPYNKKLV